MPEPRHRKKPAMSEKDEKSERAFQHLVQVLEEAVRAGADSVGLEREGGALMVVQYSGNSGLALGPIPEELEQVLVDEIIDRAGLAHTSRGEIQISLAGKDYKMVVDERDDSGESAFNLLLKRSTRRRRNAEHYVGVGADENETEHDHDEPLPPTDTVVLEQPKVGRNDPCPCGSGRKYKRCCLNKGNGRGVLE
jgi:hypothetical protein